MSDENEKQKQHRPELVARAKPVHHDPEFRRLRDEILPAIRNVFSLAWKTGVAMSTQWADFMPAGEEGDEQFDEIVLREQWRISFDPNFGGAVRVFLQSISNRKLPQLVIFLDTKSGEVRPPVRGMEYKGKLAMCIGVLSGIQSPLPDQAELLGVAYNAIIEKMVEGAEEPAETEGAEGEGVDERPVAGAEESGTGELALEPAAADAPAGNGENEVPKPEAPAKPKRVRKSRTKVEPVAEGNVEKAS